MDILKKIYVYGDSILKGVTLDKGTKKYTISHSYEDDLQMLLPCSINNKSKFGCTIEKGKIMLEKALDKGLDCDVILLEYGGNDADYNWEEVASDPNKEHLPHTPPEVFLKTYKEIINILNERLITPVMMTLPPIDAGRYFDWITSKGLCRENILTWLGDVSHIYQHQEMYSGFVTNIAYETGTPLIDARSAFLRRRDFNSLICEDGIHPSEKGQSLIKEILLTYGKDHMALT